MSSITDEAIQRVRNERQAIYGHPSVNFTRIAAFWSTYLGILIEPNDIPMLMILLKVARNMETSHRDNRVDIIGYVECLELVVNEGE